MADDDQLSRPPMVSPFGKCDTRVQTLMPETAVHDLRRKAAANGVTESELARTVLLTWLYGRDMVKASLVEHYESMVGTERELRLPLMGEVGDVRAP